MFELVDSAPESATIRVIGVGGGGGNAVQHMLKQNVEGVDFIAANTDAQALKSVSANTILQLGASVTQGLGAGPIPKSGGSRRWRTAIESRKSSLARTWCSSPPEWAAARGRAPRPSSRRSPRNSASLPSPS